MVKENFDLRVTCINCVVLADNTLNTLLRLQKGVQRFMGNLINITLEIGLKSDVEIVKNDLWIITYYHVFRIQHSIIRILYSIKADIETITIKQCPSTTIIIYYIQLKQLVSCAEKYLFSTIKM